MTHTIGHITFGTIKNVRKCGTEEGVYYADVEFSEAEGFPMETHMYTARSDDYAMTGRWVYQQIIDGNFDGEITQLLPYADPVTGIVPAKLQISQGAQEL
jgi:hypothetical protein